MDYNLIVDPDALRPLFGRVSASMIACIERNLYRLSNDPLTHGRRPLIPLPGGGQEYYFTCEDHDTTYHFSANFVFTVDEHSIYIRIVQMVH